MRLFRVFNLTIALTLVSCAQDEGKTSRTKLTTSSNVETEEEIENDETKKNSERNSRKSSDVKSTTDTDKETNSSDSSDTTTTNIDNSSNSDNSYNPVDYENTDNSDADNQTIDSGPKVSLEDILAGNVENNTTTTPTTSNSTNLLSSVGFEQIDFADWNKYTINSTDANLVELQRTSDRAKSGTYSLSLKGSATQVFGAQQNITSALNTSGSGNYIVSAWLGAEASGQQATLELVYKQSGLPEVSQTVNLTISNSTEFEKISDNFAVNFSGEVESAFFRITHSGSDTLYIDDAELSKVDP